MLKNCRIILVLFGYCLTINLAEANKHVCENNFINYVSQYYLATDSGDFLPQEFIATKESAYVIQACIVYTKRMEIIGFKAGLTNRAAQKRFNTNRPVFGVLHEDAFLYPHKFVKQKNVESLIEAELAFRVRENISNLSVINKSIEELVDAVAPAIEIPLINFPDINKITGNDIIAANVGAYKVIVGNFTDIKEVRVNEVTIDVSLDGKIQNNPPTSKHLENQWLSLKWLIKKALLEGYNLKKGQILLTGSITKPRHSEKGTYEFVFNGLGEIKLTVEIE